MSENSTLCQTFSLDKKISALYNGLEETICQKQKAVEE